MEFDLGTPPEIGTNPLYPHMESGSWRCIVCTKPVNNILVLPCQHRFCERCLHLWVGVYVDQYRGHKGQFPCQLCWELFEVPVGGLHAFRQDFQVTLLQDQLDKLSMDFNSSSPRNRLAQNTEVPVNNEPQVPPPELVNMEGDTCDTMVSEDARPEPPQGVTQGVSLRHVVTSNPCMCNLPVCHMLPSTYPQCGLYPACHHYL